MSGGNLRDYHQDGEVKKDDNKKQNRTHHSDIYIQKPNLAKKPDRIK
jgi:hypothetical protein